MVFEAFKYVCYIQCTGQTLPVLFQSYLLQVMYMAFQYLTVSCLLTIEHVPNICAKNEEVV